MDRKTGSAASPDLDALEAYLDSGEVHPASMHISDLDGFLTGIACTPEPIPPEEWLNDGLGDERNVPAAIRRIVLEMYNETRQRLERGQPIEPLFWETDKDGVIAMDWCEGFMDAVKMRPERWNAFAQTDTGSKLMRPILVHMVDDQGNSVMGIRQGALEVTLDTAAEALPTIVPAIYRHIRMITRN